MKNFNFVTDGSKVYRFGNNDWYAVEQDDDKVMLVDTDCKVGDIELEMPWSDGNWKTEDGENGQYILNYTNYIVYKYFGALSYAIEPRTVDAGTGKFESAYMWPMSYEEFKCNKVIGGKIVENSNNYVWTRTFSGTGCSVSNVWTRTFSPCDNNGRYAWAVGSADGALGSFYVSSECRVAPAFYLRKSAIDHIEENGEIILDNPQTLAKKTAKEYEILLYNAILAWYDDNINTYYGLDDPDFIDRVCDRLGLSLDEYFCLVLEF